jgi:hypothetical protein
LEDAKWECQHPGQQAHPGQKPGGSSYDAGYQAGLKRYCHKQGGGGDDPHWQNPPPQYSPPPDDNDKHESTVFRTLCAAKILALGVPSGLGPAAEVVKAVAGSLRDGLKTLDLGADFYKQHNLESALNEFNNNAAENDRRCLELVKEWHAAIVDYEQRHDVAKAILKMNEAAMAAFNVVLDIFKVVLDLTAKVQAALQ